MGQISDPNSKIKKLARRLRAVAACRQELTDRDVEQFVVGRRPQPRLENLPRGSPRRRALRRRANRPQQGVVSPQSGGTGPFFIGEVGPL